jgi:hypothetical protein
MIDNTTCDSKYIRKQRRFIRQSYGVYLKKVWLLLWFKVKYREIYRYLKQSPDENIVIIGAPRYFLHSLLNINYIPNAKDFFKIMGRGLDLSKANWHIFQKGFYIENAEYLEMSKQNAKPIKDLLAYLYENDCRLIITIENSESLKAFSSVELDLLQYKIVNI